MRKGRKESWEDIGVWCGKKVPIRKKAGRIIHIRE
jgi:hypothetical protein